MTKFNIGLFFLAACAPALGVKGDSSLRGAPSHPDSASQEQIQRDLASHGYGEKLGRCHGAVCGLWGDPHMITCDGKNFDCQGIGTFNLMENHFYKIQGRFVEVGAVEQEKIVGWGLTEGATLTNDISVDFKFDDDIGPIQFGFGDVSTHEGIFPSEEGCEEYVYYEPDMRDMDNVRRTEEPTLQACRERCVGVVGCTKFSYWADRGCHINNDAATPRAAPRSWSRALAGSVNECGLPLPPPDLNDPEERWKHGSIGNSCPLLLHRDGELVDISSVGQGQFYFGDSNSAVSAQNINNRIVVIRYTLYDGTQAEIQLFARGDGPGELWSCHWDFYVCLPESEQQEFMNHSTGLLGTPDGNRNNDFMDAMGEEIQIVKESDEDWHKTFIDYCYENHCTEQIDSIMSPPAGQTFEDIKCEPTEYTDFSINSTSCILSAGTIVDRCMDYPPLLRHGCEVDCCFGGCNELDDAVRDEVTGIIRLEDDPDAIIYDIAEPVPACAEDGLKNTGDTVCPSSEVDVVKLISTSGTQDLPVDADVFFGIEMDTGDDELGRTVKFKVNNPFDDAADVYVKYGKSVFGHAFMDPKCHSFTETPVGCDEDASIIEVACHDYDNIDPFAIVQVYFASSSVSGTTEIDSCCEPSTYGPRTGVVMYSFEIQCACPENSSATA